MASYDILEVACPMLTKVGLNALCRGRACAWWNSAAARCSIANAADALAANSGGVCSSLDDLVECVKKQMRFLATPGGLPL